MQKSKIKYQNYRLKFKIFALCIVILLFAFCFLHFVLAARAQSSIRSDNYEITWPNLNMGAGMPTAEGIYKLGVTTGQTAPGLYEYENGYKVRAGFQYIHSIIPFYFKLSAISLDFGILEPQVLKNKQLTLTVNSGSAGGYQVKAQESDPLTSRTGSTIVDTTCDSGNHCNHDTDFGTWIDNINTYGFGYTMTGNDVPLDFDSGTKFRNFADAPGEDPIKIMGLTPVEGHKAGRNKIATMSARINISNTQAAGSYKNVLTFIATPTY